MQTRSPDRRRREVQVAVPTDDSDFLMANGMPCWPIRDRTESVRLQRLADILGLSVKEVKASPGRSDGQGVVAAATPASSPMAELYAHLTQRRTGGMHELGEAEVVVGTIDEFTPPLLTALFDDDHRSSGLGIVVARDAASLRSEVLRKSITAFGGWPERLKRVEMHPASNLADVVGDGWRVLGGQANRAQVVNALSDPSDLLQIVANADGIDAMLGDGLSLCSVRNGHSPSSEPPPCIQSGFCRRALMSVDDAHRRGLTLSPSEISSQVLVFGGCWGFAPPTAMGAPSDGLGVQLSESESIAVVITHWESVVSSSAYYVALLDDLASGMPAGEAVQRHNRAHRRAETGNRLCLVGDPAFRFQMQTRSERSDVALDIGASARSSLRDLAGAVSFLRSFSSALITSDHPVYHDNSATFEDSMRDVDEDITAGRAPTAEHSLRLRDETITFLAGRWTHSVALWSRWVGSQTYLEDVVCWSCGGSARRYTAELWIAPCQRTVSVCARCGYLADVPTTKSVSLELGEAGILVCRGQTTGATAAITLQSAGRQLSVQWPQTTTELSTTMAWPFERGDVEPGAVRLTLAVVWNDLTFATSGCHVRGERIARWLADGPDVHML